MNSSYTPPSACTEDRRHVLLIYRRTDETYRAVKRDLHDSWSDTLLLWQEVSGWCWDSPRAECRSDTAQSPAELQARHRALNTEPSPAPGGASPPEEGKHDRFYSESHSIWKPLLLFIIYADIKRNWGVRSSDVCVLPCWWHSWRLRRTQSPSPAPPGRRWRWSARWHTNTQTHTSVLVQEVVFMNKINTFCVSELDIWIWYSLRRGVAHRWFSLFGPKESLMSLCRWMARWGILSRGRGTWTSRWTSLLSLCGHRRRTREISRTGFDISC